MAPRLRHATEIPVIMKPCPTCWGAGSLYAQEGLNIRGPYTCKTCLGTREIMSSGPVLPPADDDQ